MQIVTLNGSSRSDGANGRLLNCLSEIKEGYTFIASNIPAQLPLYKVDVDKNPLPDIVVQWRNLIRGADGIVICTPEYLHNLPAILKSALEWLTTSGELSGKRVLALTLTPHAPRGEKAMQSLLWTLKALDARVLASLPMYQNELDFNGEDQLKGTGFEVLSEALNLFDI